MTMIDKKDKSLKARNWTFLVYPESAPDNWLDLLQETGCAIAISPLHDKDLNPDGEVKKPHYHILICFNSPTTYNVVNNICENLKQPIPKKVLSVKGIYRYLTHEDNPEKYHYNKSDIITLNGFDVDSYITMTTTERLTYFKAIFSIIKENHITEYCDLIDFLMKNELNEFLTLVCGNTMLFNAYLKAKHFKIREENKL